MKIYLGPYNHWFRPYSWAKRLVFWAIDRKQESEDKTLDRYEQRVAFVRKWFGWLRPIEDWVDARTKRKIRVRIHDYDVWNADHSLGLIILPTLELLKKNKIGGPYVDDSDVPEELRSTAAPPLPPEKAAMGHVDENHFKRWDWVLDEMIWAFHQVVNEDSDSQFFKHHPTDSDDVFGGKIDFDKEGYQKWEARKRHGLTLFGKYYEALWD